MADMITIAGGIVMAFIFIRFWRFFAGVALAAFWLAVLYMIGFAAWMAIA